MGLNLIKKVTNQTIYARYFPPKTERQIEDTVPNYKTKTIADVLNSYPKDYLDKDYNDVISDSGKRFRGRNGIEDVYKKSGYEHEIFEYLDRQYGTKRNYRLMTDSLIDFKAGGWIEVYGEVFLILKVIALDNDITTQNQSRFKRNTYMNKYSPKLLALG